MPRISKKVEKQVSIIADDDALQAVVLEALQEKKAQDLCAVDFREALEQPLFDTFIICSATSRTHADALCENVMRRVYGQFHIEPSHAEGRELSEWILIDYFNIVVHIFLAEKRHFYDIEGLWNDASIKRYE